MSIIAISLLVFLSLAPTIFSVRGAARSYTCDFEPPVARSRQMSFVLLCCAMCFFPGWPRRRRCALPAAAIAVVARSFPVGAPPKTLFVHALSALPDLVLHLIIATNARPTAHRPRTSTETWRSSFRRTPETTLPMSRRPPPRGAARDEAPIEIDVIDDNAYVWTVSGESDGVWRQHAGGAKESS